MKRHFALPALLMAIGLALGPFAPDAARAETTLEADVEDLMACVAEAFPEGEIPGAPSKRISGGDCIGLIARSTDKPCGPSPSCVARETTAWLTIARRLEREALPERNKAAVKAAVGGIERQARSLCLAAAAVSAWGRDAVAKGGHRVRADDECLRDAVAGMVVPLMGHLRGN